MLERSCEGLKLNLKEECTERCKQTQERLSERFGVEDASGGMFWRPFLILFFFSLDFPKVFLVLRVGMARGISCDGVPVRDEMEREQLALRLNDVESRLRLGATAPTHPNPRVVHRPGS